LLNNSNNCPSSSSRIIRKEFTFTGSVIPLTYFRVKKSVLSFLPDEKCPFLLIDLKTGILLIVLTTDRFPYYKLNRAFNLWVLELTFIILKGVFNLKMHS
ncbi:MAG: hypothetical protein E7I11_12720, partial [Klebsiella michiganensis]|nr:hypothetical protein [Klebsiella michiganensis]